AVVRLGQDQVVDVDAELLRVLGVEGVLRVHEGDLAAGLLRVGHRVQGQGRLTGGLRTVDLHRTAAGQATDAQGYVERGRPGRDDLDGLLRPVTHAHDIGRAPCRARLYVSVAEQARYI